jgi:hypothetical protein
MPEVIETISREVVDDLTRRLRARSAEIEAALTASILNVHEPSPEAEAELIAGLGAMLRDGLAFSIAAFEQGEAWADPLPQSIVDQVAYVVKMGMPLDELLRGYSAGNTVISRFVAEECKRLPPEALDYSIEVQLRVAEALIGGLSTEYARQEALLDRSPAQRRVREVERLLAGEPFNVAEIDYRLDAWHRAGVVFGPRAGASARLLAERLGAQLLLVPRSAEALWAWWGTGAPVPGAKAMAAAADLPAGATFTLGECRQGVEGLRDSHREAQLVTDVAIRAGDRVVRAADAMLLALLLRDRSLAELFLDAQLARLRAERDWPTLAETLRAYFDSDAVLGSAAATLGVDRHTISRRLRRIEDLLGRSLASARTELEVALRLDSLLVRDPRAR